MAGFSSSPVSISFTDSKEATGGKTKRRATMMKRPPKKPAPPKKDGGKMKPMPCHGGKK
jgi:hypothetical protein